LINVDVDGLRGGNYQYLVRGIEMSDVEKAAEGLKMKLQSNPGFPFVNLDIKNDEPKLVVDVQEEQAQKFGFSKKEIQSLLQQSYAGGSAATIQKGNKQFKVFVELESEFKNNPAALGKLHLRSSKGTQIPLKALASWTESLGSPTFYRVDQLPSGTISFSMDKAIPINKGLEAVEKMAAEILPPSVKGKFQGAAAMVQSTLNETTMLILAAILVMYIVLGILYESFIHPLTILSSLPFAGLGGVLTLILFGQSLTLFSVVGFILLIGIVKKNGIMMVDYALELRKNRAISAEQAILEGCLVRFRPIMMTTIAAIMGALPIAIGFGEGAETRRGLGLVIVGGLLFSQMLTLFVTPIIYLMLEKISSYKLIPQKQAG
jgi:HAE1 family hydrophobic/amphiphilic exporter-1